MNADELVRTLREDARQSRDVLHICHSVLNAEEAADLIESLQAKISRLQAQLAEARRRERAAVERRAGKGGTHMTCRKCNSSRLMAWVNPKNPKSKEIVCLNCGERQDGEPQHMTNADRIRSMTDEELARFLGDEPPYFSTYYKYLEWLQQPVEAEK